MAEHQATLYTTRTCGFCMRAKALLDSKGVNYREVPVDGNREARMDLMARTGQHTVPQIWIGDRHVGGCDELYQLERSGQLDLMLNPAQ